MILRRSTEVSLHVKSSIFARRTTIVTSIWIGVFVLSTGHSTVRADVILDWNALALDCIRVDNTAPTISTRNLAILNTAIYDAANSITRTHQPYLVQLTAPTDCSAEAAVVGAAYEVITGLYPSFAHWADDLYNDYLATAVPGAALTNGLDFGWWI